MKRILSVAAAVILCLLCAGASGDTLIVPVSLTEIGEEAFMGDASLTHVLLPYTLVSVGDRAFSGCSGLRIVDFPGVGTDIGEDVFNGATAAMLIRTEPGSEAAVYARRHQIDYQAGTVYRALAFYCEYSGQNRLFDTRLDAQHLQSGLQTLTGTPWSVTRVGNLTSKAALQSAIRDAFADATEDDVSLFAFSGHGLVNYAGQSCIALNTFVTVTGAELRAMLDTVPGRKVVLLDCCFSGGMIVDAETSDAASPDDTAAEESEPVWSPADFVSGMTGAFSVRSRAALDSAGYFVITACSPDEVSWSLGDGGAFTTALLKGIGYDIYSGVTASMPADTDGDDAVSVSEAFVYAKAEALRVLSMDVDEDGNPMFQTAQCYPAGCAWFAPFRR